MVFIDFDNNDTYTRFWSKVDIGGLNECWNWTASINKAGGGGCGQFQLGGIQTAYRIAYALHHKKQLDDIKLLMHSCDNRACCNPHHLKEGNQKDNMIDCKAKGRCRNGSTKLTADDVAVIRELGKTDMLHREIAAQFNVGRTAICRIINGSRWTVKACA